MHKEAAARITRRSVSDLELLGHEIAPMSYDIRDYAKLGLLHQLLHTDDPLHPTESAIVEVRKALADAIADARANALDLSNHWHSPEAQQTRKAGIAARALMEQQWARA
jgi:biotin-independent malonate decarboxylase gamma subunit